jgi:hypothetical protein
VGEGGELSLLFAVIGYPKTTLPYTAPGRLLLQMHRTTKLGETGTPNPGNTNYLISLKK